MILKILVTGANGQLGSELKVLAHTLPLAQFTFVDIAEMDLGADQAIHAFFEGNHFDYVINCAAYTAVDKAEEEKLIAFRVNAEAVKTLATLCKAMSIRLIHISTDYVFDGNGNLPIREDAIPNPLSVYGESKLLGEKYVRDILRDAYIIRTAWVYSSFGKNFVKTISRLAQERDSLNVVNDQVGSPTYARDLAAVILAMIEKVESGSVDVPGTYHFSNEGVISWYDFACFIVGLRGLRCSIQAIPSELYPTPAARPRFSVLDKAKLKNVFGIHVRHWYEGLQDCLRHLDSGG